MSINSNKTLLLHSILLPFILFSLLLPADSTEPYNLRFSSLEEIKEDFKSVPCKDTDRLDGVRNLFEKMGAGSDEISIQEFKDIKNLVIEKRGESEEIMVLGAHYDKVSEGCGAIDNWTGIVALAHLYRSVKNIPLKKKLIFVAFGKEERGLHGSRAMVKEIAKDQIPNYCAMINIDSLGMGMPQAAMNLSTAKLIDRAASLAKKMNIPFAKGMINGDSDSSSFKSRKIPALTIHGLASGFEEVIHSRHDRAEKVDVGSVYLGYRLALALALDLESSPCEASR